MEAIEVKLNAADKKIAPADAERNGYTFVGWYKDKGLETAFDKENDLIDADTTLYAKWTIKTYTVTFNTNGGSAVAAETVIFDKRVQKPDAPTKDGASFEGWYKDSALTEEYDFVNDRISEDTTIYAKWGTLTYAVSFVTNGGSPITTLRVPARSDFKTVLADVVTTKPGYKFSGWYTDEALIEKLEYEKPQNVAIVEADTVLYAYWRPSPYTVIFMDRDTEFSKQGVYYPNKVIDPGYPEEREGYVFVGWCSDEALTRAFDFDTLVTEDTTVYAKWKEVVYTLTFNAAGGSAVDPVVDLKKGVAVTMPTDPVKEGYTFGGWYTDKGCTKLFDPTKGVKKNTVLYAKWEAPETETVDEGISGGAIAGIVITIVLMAAAIAAVSIFLVKKKIIR